MMAHPKKFQKVFKNGTTLKQYILAINYTSSIFGHGVI